MCVFLKAKADSPDPCAAHAEFQTWRSSAVQEIQLRVQSIFSLRTDDLAHDGRALMWRWRWMKRCIIKTHAGHLEVKCCVVSHWLVDKPAVNIWKFPLFFFFFTTVKSHNDTKTSNEGALHSKLFLFIETAVALHSACLQWQIPSQTWKWSKRSKPLWKADNLRSKLTPSWLSLHF